MIRPRMTRAPAPSSTQCSTRARVGGESRPTRSRATTPNAAAQASAASSNSNSPAPAEGGGSLLENVGRLTP